MSLALQSVKFPTQTAMKISVLVHSREFYKCLTCSPIEPFWNSSHDLDGGHGVHREHTDRHMETKPAFQTLARATFTVVTAKSACKGGADGHQRHSSPVTPHLIPEDENSTLWTARVTTLQTGKDLKTEKNDRDHTIPLMNTETRLKWRYVWVIGNSCAAEMGLYKPACKWLTPKYVLMKGLSLQLTFQKLSLEA